MDRIYNNETLNENLRNTTLDEKEFLINPEYSICGSDLSKKFLFITFVIIGPDYFEKRDLIRKTWGNKNISSDFRVIFTVGLSKSELFNKKIYKESEIHNDILQINNFNDSYYNMTTKIMKSFKWISKYCSNVEYILRLNDDVVVNTYQLINDFKNFYSYQSNSIYGYKINGVGPDRDNTSKFYISEEEYNITLFDDYPDGLCF